MKFKNIPIEVSVLMILVLFTMSGNTFAQVTFNEAIKNYQHGTVISHTGDTLHGKIDNREWLITPSMIELVQKDKKKIFSATDIKEFRVGDNTYRSVKVDLDVSPVRLKHLNISSAPTIVQDTTLFFLLLSKGKVNLYYLMDAANKKHFFYQKDGQYITALEFYKHYYDATKRQVATKNTYKNQLAVLSAACKEEIYYDISYSRKEMVKFFNKLNSCLTVDGPVPVITENPKVKAKSKLKGAVFAGVHHANYYFSENIYGNNNEGSYSRLVPSLGLNVSYIFPNSLEQFSLSLSTQYQHQKIDYSYRIGKSWEISDEFNSSNILMAVNFRYSIPFIGKIRPYISAGPILKCLIDPGLAKKKKVFDYEGDLITSRDDHFEFSAFVPGGSAGIGIEHQRFNFEVRYYRDSTNELSEGKLSGRKGSIKTNSLSVLVYYNILY